MWIKEPLKSIGNVHCHGHLQILFKMVGACQARKPGAFFYLTVEMFVHFHCGKT